ncbi:MAG: hypothetical protein C4294_19965, partial [Nitrospiraceae bacterium]
FLNLNMAREPLSDIRVRQAILYAIDRDAHLAVFGGPPVAENVVSVVPAQFMPGGLTQEEAEQAGVAYGRDLDRARQLSSWSRQRWMPIARTTRCFRKSCARSGSQWSWMWSITRPCTG